MLILFALALPGLMRLSFETDVLAVLPSGLEEVEALKVYREHFDEDHQVLLLLEHPEGIFEEDVMALRDHLAAELPEATIRYQSLFEDDPEALAASLARMWADFDPDRVASMAAKLTNPEALKKSLAGKKEEVRLAIDQGDAAIAAYDPLGFLDHPAIAELQGNDFGYQSDDGTLWFLTIARSNLEPGYRENLVWTDQIREAANSWLESPDQDSFSFQLTGGPVFNAEIGTGMENDMSGTIMWTSILVGLLFLITQRSPVQLFLLGVILALVFAITLGFAGWIFGRLNMASAGFAAILVGLVIDYGVVIAREARSDCSPAVFRKLMAPGILWAAVTTAVVFGLLTLSTFTGVRQLGALILIGLLVGAVCCLWIFPVVLQRFPPKPASHFTSAPFPSTKVCVVILLGALLIPSAIFLIKGSPSISFSFSMVQPTTSEAARTLKIMQDNFPAWSKRNLIVVASGKDADEVREKSYLAEERIKKLKETGTVVRSEWPVGLPPNLVARATNQQSWQKVIDQEEDILRILEESGFTEEGRHLNASILRKIGEEKFEDDPFTKLFYHDDGVFAGRIELADEISAESIKELDQLNRDGLVVTGWEILQPILLPMVKRDFYWVFLPATVALLGALLFVFRSWKDTALTITVLLLSLLMVNGLVSWTGVGWNFLSGMAIPLIVGTGIDYSIHLIFALRRSQGDLDELWNGVGKAICFCGLSTVIGFGSLIFASNEMLRSMGLLCSFGVFCTMTLSVLVVPRLWTVLNRSRHGIALGRGLGERSRPGEEIS